MCVHVFLGFIVYSLFFVYVYIVCVWATLPELNELDICNALYEETERLK